MQSPYRYHVVTTDEAARRPAVAAVRSWLHEEAHAFRATCPEPEVDDHGSAGRAPEQRAAGGDG